MSRWLEAAKQGYWSSEDNPNPPKAKTTETPKTQVKGESRNHKNHSKEVLGSYGSFGFWGKGVCMGGPYHPAAIAAGVAAAFDDLDAMNDPHRPEAWS